MAPSAAVVVATYNRSGSLPRLLAGLEAQRGVDEFEVVVVNDGSSDDTSAVLRTLARRVPVNVLTIDLPSNAGPATARNVGWRATSAPVVAFTDDDCVPTPDWLAHLLDNAQGHDIVQGRTVPDPAQRDKLGPFSRTLDISTENGYYQTCNIAYRREVLEALDGFHEEFRFPAGEDTDLAWRAKEAGATTVFAADAVVHHDVRPSDFMVALRDSWRWQSAALAVSRHPGLRQAFASRYFWRPSHRVAVGAAVGVALIGRAPTSRRAWATGLALTAPYIRFRTATAPLPGAGPRRRWLLLPAAFAVDGAEVIACLVGSVKHGVLIV